MAKGEDENWQYTELGIILNGIMCWAVIFVRFICKEVYVIKLKQKKCEKIKIQRNYMKLNKLQIFPIIRKAINILKIFHNLLTLTCTAK